MSETTTNVKKISSAIEESFHEAQRGRTSNISVSVDNTLPQEDHHYDDDILDPKDVALSTQTIYQDRLLDWHFDISATRNMPIENTFGTADSVTTRLGLDEKGNPITLPFKYIDRVVMFGLLTYGNKLTEVVDDTPFSAKEFYTVMRFVVGFSEGSSGFYNPGTDMKNGGKRIRTVPQAIRTLRTGGEKSKQVADMLKIASLIQERQFDKIRVKEHTMEFLLEYLESDEKNVLENHQKLKQHLKLERSDSTEHFDEALELLFSGGATNLQEKLLTFLVGPNGARIEKIANMAWNQYAQSPEYIEASQEEKLKQVDKFFPEGSYTRDYHVVKLLDPKTEGEMTQAISLLTTSPGKTALKRQLWTLRLAALGEAAGVEKKLEVLQETFEAPSPLRDQLIEEVLLSSKCTRSEIEGARAMLYENNVFEADLEYMTTAYASRALAQGLYVLDSNAKADISQELFGRSTEVADETALDLPAIITPDQIEETIHGLFSGREQLFHRPDVEHSFEGLLLSMSLSTQEMKAHIYLQKAEKERLNHAMAMVKSKRGDDEDMSDDYLEPQGSTESDSVYNTRAHAYRQGQDITVSREVRKKEAKMIAFAKKSAAEFFEKNEFSPDIGVDEYINKYYEYLLALLEDDAPSLGGMEKLLEKTIMAEWSKKYYMSLNFRLELIKAAIKQCEAILPEQYLSRIPAGKHALFTILRSLPVEQASQGFAKFLTTFVRSKNRSRESMIAAFFSSFGPAIAKGGQLLASSGSLGQTFVDALSHLSADMSPMSIFDIVDTLDVEGVDFETIGPLCGAATVRQTHFLKRAGVDAQQVVKITRPQVLREVLDGQIPYIQRIVDVIKEDPARMGGIHVPPDFISALSEAVIDECGTMDITQQRLFAELYAGRKIGRRMLNVPKTDSSVPVTPAFRIETVVNGRPLSRQLDQIDEDMAEAMLKFFLESIFSGHPYHADPHPGNIMMNDERIGIIDYGVVARLSPENRESIKTLLGALASKNKETIVESAIAGHILNGSKIKSINFPLLYQGVDQFLNSMESGLDVAHISQQFFSVLEDANVFLDHELKSFTTTIARLGFFINRVNPLKFLMILQSQLNSGEVTEDTMKKYDEAMKQARETIKNSDAAPEQEEKLTKIILPKGAVIVEHMSSGRDRMFTNQVDLEIDLLSDELQKLPVALYRTGEKGNEDPQEFKIVILPATAKRYTLQIAGVKYKLKELFDKARE